jgi:hypothetical protein
MSSISDNKDTQPLQKISQPTTTKVSSEQTTTEISNKAQNLVMSSVKAVKAILTQAITPSKGGQIVKVYSTQSVYWALTQEAMTMTCKKLMILLNSNFKQTKAAKSPAAANEVKMAAWAAIEAPKVPLDSKKIEQGAQLLSAMKQPDLNKNEIDKDEILKSLHKQNINTPQEVITGYKSVLTTRELFTSLAQAYSNATPEKKREYQEFASSWLESKMYNNELTNSEAKEGIKAFITVCLKDRGKDFTNSKELSDKAQILNIKFFDATQTEASKPPPASKGTEITSLKDLGKDPKKIANEFRSLYYGLQTKITAHDLVKADKDAADINKSKSNNVLIAGKATNTLSFYINNDILFSTSKNKAVEKYKMYLNVGNEALKSGDTATIQLLYTVLCGPIVTTLISEKDLKTGKNETDDYTKILKKLEETGSPDKASFNLKEMAKTHPHNPISLEATVTKELIMGSEGNPTTITSGEHEGKFNSNRIEIFGKLIGGFQTRLGKMTNNTPGEMNLEGFLKDNPKDAGNIFWDRKQQIKDNGWG